MGIEDKENLGNMERREMNISDFTSGYYIHGIWVPEISRPHCYPADLDCKLYSVGYGDGVDHYKFIKSGVSDAGRCGSYDETLSFLRG